MESVDPAKHETLPQALSVVTDPIGIVVRGAREHNLKNISVVIPRDCITVVTGLSGSGKSSLAFDTIYAEGQRRYIESLSAFARQYMDQLKKPDVDAITGLSPAIAIDQKSLSLSPRSTVGTVTEVYDYLRLLYAKAGTPHCPVHHLPVRRQAPEEIVQDIMRRPRDQGFNLLAPVARAQKGEFLAEFAKWAKKGFHRARVDGRWVELGQATRLEKHKRHNIELLVDRLFPEEKFLGRLRESVNLALSLAGGLVTVEPATTAGKAADKAAAPKTYSLHHACPECGLSLPDLEPRLFSFNHPSGACQTCKGMGVLDFDEDEYDEEEDIDERSLQVCPDCQGRRLRPEALSVLLGGLNIAEVAEKSASDLSLFLRQIELRDRERLIADKILRHMDLLLSYMIRVGTGYLALARPTRTLSGGEVQRLRLATQVGSALVGVLYVLDEPSIGLHPHDHHRLLDIIKEMRDRGNTLLLVEHDEDTILAADHVIDLGPRAGRLGGELLAAGSPAELSRHPASVTGAYLSGRERVPLPSERRPASERSIDIRGATGNNLKNVDLRIPLGLLCGVTGVSGSGKSTLVIDTLYRALAKELYGSAATPAPFAAISGTQEVDKVIEINQRPIGRTPRSIPATYVGVFSVIRDLFATLPEAQLRGFTPGHFSFNVKGGRCETCQGGGSLRVAMHFLADVFVKCEVCEGRRYTPEVLSIRYRDKSIADVLEMTVSEAFDFFQHHPRLRKKLETLHRVGLDYLTLGQSSTTLSGGEAQRVKLSRELSKRSTGRTLYILDEPTTGLHFADIRKLIELLHELVDQGNTVVVIEHNMDVIKNCDHVIDLGPDGGDAGGRILVAGTPEEVARCSQSLTAPYLDVVLKRR